MDRSSIAIVIPALNEAGTIAQVVAKVGAYGLPIVVDDGSSDATGALASAAGAEVVRHPVNRGYEGALSSGFVRAAELGCQYVITIDADGQHNPAQLAQYIHCLDQGYDLVLGVRDRFQRISEVIFAKVGKLVWKISDPLCGMKGYQIALYTQAGCFDSIHAVGTELAVRAVVNGCKFIQLPVITRDRLDRPRYARQLAANYMILRGLTLLLGLHLTKKLKYKL